MAPDYLMVFLFGYVLSWVRSVGRMVDNSRSIINQAEGDVAMTMLEAEQAAQNVLRAHFDGTPSLFPIDPVEIARQVGINVYQAQLGGTVSGMIARTEHAGETDLFINSDQAPVRQRFTVAHELGHYFAIVNDPSRSESTFVHRRDARSSCGEYNEEIYANQFAAELLMPRAEVSRLVQLGMSTPELASRFKVSVDAITNRVKNVRPGAFV